MRSEGNTLALIRRKQALTTSRGSIPSRCVACQFDKASLGPPRIRAGRQETGFDCAENLI